MSLGNKTKVFLLFLGDVAILYASLFATLALRYGSGFWDQFTDTHAAPFSILFIFWVLIFYVAGLYDLRRLRNNLDFLKTLALSVVADAVISVVAFYAIPQLGIAPKTNLFIFIVIFAIVEVLWRRAFNRMTESGEAPNRTLLVGSGATADEAARSVDENPQLGYTIAFRMAEETASASPEGLKEMIDAHRANLVVVPRELKRKAVLAPTLYQLFGQGIAIIDLDTFYELIMRKVPLGDVGEAWFLENIENAAKFYDPFKRAVEFLVAIVIGLILLPFELLIALLVAVTSPGPVIYRQKRVGTGGKEFWFYKFRSMRMDAEKNGAQWTMQNDPRNTAFGKFIRITHLDELPQLWNIVKGDLSFVGPRPERPEFVAKLKAEVPFYEVRLLVKPGVTGWAQLHYHADLSIEDVKQKLQYDVYYLKNRSPILDLTIILKTLKSLFVNPK